MATTVVSQTPSPAVHQLATKQQTIIPVKFGFMGEQGTGKTTTAALVAAAISKLYHNGAPIHVTDAELGWQFLNPVIFQPERIPLVQRTVPTFAAMLKDIELAE